VNLTSLTSLPARRAALAVWVVLLLVGSMLPPRVIVPAMPHIPNFDKLLHVGGYAIFCVLALWALPGRGWLWLALGVFAFGAMIEMIQPLTGRSRDVMDALANGVGVAAGLLAAQLLWGQLTRRKAK
jgi:VanZ family protein